MRSVVYLVVFLHRRVASRIIRENKEHQEDAEDLGR